MAGTIFLTEDHASEATWSAAGWLFYNVVEQLAHAVTCVALRAALVEICVEHLGSLDLSDYEAADRQLLLDLLANEVPTRLAQLPWPGADSRGPALAIIDELAAKARAVSDGWPT